jgi:hypothetical protein
MSGSLMALGPPTPSSAVIASGTSALDAHRRPNVVPTVAPAPGVQLAVTGALGAGWRPSALSRGQPRVVPGVSGPQLAAAVGAAPSRPGLDSLGTHGLAGAYGHTGQVSGTGGYGV